MINIDNNQNLPNIKYVDIKKHFEDKGYTLEQLCLDETSEIVTTFNLGKGAIGPVLSIRCPSRYKIFILGKNQLPEDTDINVAHALRVRFADYNNDEIDPGTRIIIKKVKPSEATMMVARIFYKDITVTDYQKELPHKTKSEDKWYKFDQSILVNGDEHLQIEVINTEKNIDAKNVKLSLDIDFWEEE